MMTDYMTSYDPAELDDMELEELESIGTLLMDVASYDDYFVDYN